MPSVGTSRAACVCGSSTESVLHATRSTSGLKLRTMPASASSKTRTFAASDPNVLKPRRSSGRALAKTTRSARYLPVARASRSMSAATDSPPSPESVTTTVSESRSATFSIVSTVTFPSSAIRRRRRHVTTARAGATVEDPPPEGTRVGGIPYRHLQREAVSMPPWWSFRRSAARAGGVAAVTP